MSMNSTRPQQKNVLLSAYACEPKRGSEPGIGWNTVEQISRFHRVWAMTSEEHRPAIESYLIGNPLPGVEWLYLDIPWWLRFCKKGERGRRIHYYLWQIWAYFKGREVNRQIGFDIIHHVTYGSYWTPSFLALLPVRFIWGPVGGGESAPRSFYKTFGLSGQIKEFLRDTIRRIAHYDPYLRMTARRAHIALSTTEDTALRMYRLGAKSVKVLPNIALSKREYAILNALPSKTQEVFRIFSAGRLLHWKGLHLGLAAFAAYLKENPTGEYWIFGDGPERPRLETLAHSLGIAERVCFWGDVSRSDLLQKLGESDVLLHPSLHDSGGYVCLEAMAAGRPVICLNLGGPGVSVTEKTGIKIAALSPEQSVSDLAKALKTLSDNPHLRKQMGEAGKQRVQDYYDWEKKGEQLAQLYEQAQEMKTE